MARNHIIKIKVEKDAKADLRHLAGIFGYKSLSAYMRDAGRLKKDFYGELYGTNHP